MEKDPLQKKQEPLAKEMNDGLKLFSSALAEALTEEESDKPDLLPKKARQQRWQIEIDKNIADFQKKMENGSSVLLKTLVELSKERPELFSEEIGNGIVSFMKYCTDLPDHQEEYLENLEKGASLQQLCGMSNKVLEAFYQAAKHIYEHQHYDDAVDLFSVLTLFNPKEPVFWLGLGNSEYFCQNYEPALIAYSMAALANPTDPYSHVYSSRCYEAIKDIENAIGALELAILVIGDNPEHKKLKEFLTIEQERLTEK